MNNNKIKCFALLGIVAITGAAMARPGGHGFHRGFHHGPPPMHHHHHHHGGLIVGGIIGATAAIVHDMVTPAPVVVTPAPVVVPQPVYTTPVYTAPVIVR